MTSDRAGWVEAELGVLVSPAHPQTGEPVRIIAATFAHEQAPTLRVETDQGQGIEARLVQHDGVPALSVLEFTWPASGSGALEVVATRGGAELRQPIAVTKRAGVPKAEESSAGVWPVDRSWSKREEALYSAWVRHLFAESRGATAQWQQLDDVTSDRQRNLLHDHLGFGEDAADEPTGLALRPDCADAPYFLRAYYAWKRRLPFGYRYCSRGNGAAPRCNHVVGVPGAIDREGWYAGKEGELRDVQRFFARTLAWGVHTGNTRTALDDDASDFYPLALTRAAIRPGSIYADPYGHVLVVTDWVAADEHGPATLYAIDGQPDGTITRKQFWEGNFLWNPDPKLGGSGFKAFRPVVVERGRPHEPGNPAIASDPDYADFDRSVRTLDAAAFYAHMDALIRPGQRDPFDAQQQLVKVLSEAVQGRRGAIERGEAYRREQGWPVIAMPDGYDVFETTGAWESYSTPARDMRLLIAIDTVQHFGSRVRALPSRYGIDDPQTLTPTLERLATQRGQLYRDSEYAVTYERSDGSPWTLSLGEVVERALAMRLSYNPNDCPEVRWGAPSSSEEAAPCRTRAPAEQREKMADYEQWFRARRRPPRSLASSVTASPN